MPAILKCRPSPGGVAQLVERVLYHSTRRAVPERSWVQSPLPTTEVEPGFSTCGGMLVPVLQLISPVCKTGTSLCDPEMSTDGAQNGVQTPGRATERYRFSSSGVRLAPPDSGAEDAPGNFRNCISSRWRSPVGTFCGCSWWL
jgi:hypothetical protein